MPPHITALALGNSGPEVHALHQALRSLGYEIADPEVAAALFGHSTHDVVARFQLENNLPATGAIDDTTAGALLRALKDHEAGQPPTASPRQHRRRSRPDTGRVAGEGEGTPPQPAELRPAAAPGLLDESPGYLIEGSVRSPRQPNLAGLTVTIVDHVVGGGEPIAHAVTDQSGNYQVKVPATAIGHGKEKPDLQALVYSGQTVVGSSEIIYNAGPQVRLDIDLDPRVASPISEYAALTTALQHQIGVPLRELQENATRQDITYLANKTGWDARMVAFAALADRFSQPAPAGPSPGVVAPGPVPPVGVHPGAPPGVVPPGVVVPPVGVPPVGVPPVPGAGVSPAWYYALLRAGLSTDEATLYRTDIRTVQRIWQEALDQNIIPSELTPQLPLALRGFQLQSAKRALDVRPVESASTLGELLAVSLGDDPAKQQRFAQLVAAAGSDVDALWKQVRAVLGEATERRLRLDGELAIVINGRADLLRKLHTVDGQPLSATGDLVQRGYYGSDRWLPLVDGGVPDGTPGATPQEQRANYASALAAQVRLRYPTLTVAAMVKSGETPLVADTGMRDQVHKFLTEQDAQFDIASQPIARYVKQNNLEGTVSPQVVSQIQRLQRVYQITPGDAAMNGLLKRGVDSAYAIARYREEDFVRDFAQDLGGEEQARLTHAKSLQVHHAVLNVAITYVTSRRAIPIGVHSPPQIVTPAPEPPGASDITAYAKLEELVGSMDYCACEHCRSVLSPAAYLVDLLYFLDHSASSTVKPLEVLFGRRPDLQYLPLTCENTNTALPYIDVVNEILEYFVTHQLALSQTVNGVKVDYQGQTTEEGVTTSELLASPQFVSEATYNTLAQAFFPPPLPFNRPLEALRRHFAKLELPLEDAMETLRRDDQLGPGTGTGYGWYDILLERLRLSREERLLLADSTITLPERFGFPAGTATQAVLDELAKVKGFCRKMAISYGDLIEILQTQFVNPGATLIPRLNRLGVSFENLKKFKNGALTNIEFDALVAPGVDPAEYDGDIKAWVKQNDNFSRIMQLVTIRNPVHPDDACAVEELELRYADPASATNKVAELDFVRLARFIRLWKKLGWTVQQVDQAIMALRPPGPTATTPAALDTEFNTLLPRLGLVRQLLDRLQLKPRDLSRLLAGWASIGTQGSDSLYRQMFLGSTGARTDAAFADNGYGDFLTDHTQTVADHAETLRAAFNLTGEEFSQIFKDLQFVPPGAPPQPPATTPPPPTELTLANISLIFRWGWLARALKLSVRELRLLSDMTGLDPFAPIDPPDPPVMKLLHLVEAIRATGLKPVQALYLIWNQDLSGKSAPAKRDITSLARTLRSGSAAIDREFALADDPTGELARARLALVYGDQATNFFFGLLDSTLLPPAPGALTFKTKYIHDQPALSNAVITAGENRIAYDPLRQELSFVGEMTDSVAGALQGVPGQPAAFAPAVGKLHDLSKAAIDPFRARYPELMTQYATFIASTDPIETKRSAMLARLLPGLRTRRKRQQALATASSASGFDATVVQTILADPTVLHAVGVTTADRSRPALDDLTAPENGGLTAQFFWSNTTSNTTPPDDTRDGALLDYSATGSNNLPPNPTPGNAVSGVWSGYLEVPDSGDYTLVIDSDAQGTVSLSLNGAVVPLQKNGSQWTTQNPVSLTGATLVPITLTVNQLKDRLRLRWQNSGAPLQVPPLELAYATRLIDKLGAAYTRTLKLASLTEALALAPAELGYLAALPNHRIGGDGWTNSLPVSGDPAAATAAALFAVLTAILDFALLKQELAPDDERLLGVLQALASSASDARTKLLDLTGWGEASLTALLTRLNLALGDLAQVEKLRRVDEAYSLITKAGMSGPALVAAVTNNPDNATVRDLLSALRARYDTAAWNEVLRPINDELRAAQRDALVAYVLEKFGESTTAKHIDTPEKLFEYFLMDVQMEPVIRTSRIRHALSSVQLFIERCLLNLETNVPPDRINADQWAWMKRYRVWEANRKVFLWPENWLEPELRDDQSPIFKETMTDLLQQDITEDTADAALLNYLSKLEEVAKLEPCGVFHIEAASRSNPITHVVARAAGAHRKYFYRSREGQNWSPWTPIKLDIEDNPVQPVVWKGRLLLFWLKVLKQGQLAAAVPDSSDHNLTSLKTTDITTDRTKTTIQAVLCWSEYYNGKWQGMRTSDVEHPAVIDLVDADPASSTGFNRSKVRLYAREEEDTLHLFVESSDNWNSSFRLYNTHSLPDIEPVYDYPVLPREITATADRLHARYYPPSVQTMVEYDGMSSQDIINHDFLTRLKLGLLTIAAPMHGGLADMWRSPFLVADGRHAFNVTTATSQAKDASPYTMTIDVNPGRMVEAVVRDPRPPRELPYRVDTILTQPFFGVMDPMPMATFLSEDAYIVGAMASPGVVNYNGVAIGPAGAARNGHATGR